MATAQAPTAVVHRRAKKKSRVVPVVGVVLLGAASWWGWVKTHPAVDPTANLLTATVTRGDLNETVSATGSITAQTGAEVKIGSQITGTIERLYADVGSQVKAGQLIAKLRLPDLDAQLRLSQSNLASAQMKAVQQQSGVGMQQTQTSSAVQQARAAVNSAQARLAAAQAAAKLQAATTPNTINQAKAAVNASQAALSTARSSLAQVQADTSLQIQTAQEQVNQAKSTAALSQITLKRNQSLLAKGFVAQAVVDTAQTTSDLSQSQVTSAAQNIGLVKNKVAADLQAAKDQVASAQQNLASVRAALITAQAGTYSDQSRLAEVETARADVRQAQANLQLALGNITQNTLKQQDVQQAKDAVQASKAQVDYTAAQLDKTLIRSPISGTVLQLAAQQGETLAAGLSAPTLIIVADLKRLQVDAFVDETDIGKVKIGQEATVTVDAFPKRPFKGRVTKIASGSTIQAGVVTYDVTVAMQDLRARLKPDMTATVTLQTGHRGNVLLVPAEAVKLGVRGSTVSVVDKVDGKSDVHPVKVQTGVSDGTNTEIRSGLKEGQTVVLAGMTGGGPGRGAPNPFGGKKAGGGR